ncbi:f-box family protein, partial [Genlisea aurea]
GLELLPAALIATVMTKLDVPSILSLASTCKAFRSCGEHILSFLPCFHIPDFAPSMNYLRPLLSSSNPHLRSLKLDCTRLDDSCLDFVVHPSLQELHLRNCARFSGRLLSQLGHFCHDLRILYLSSVAEKRGKSIDILHLKDLLTGCSNLETLILMFNVPVFICDDLPEVWDASSKLKSLEIGYIPSAMATAMLRPRPPTFSGSFRSSAGSPCPSSLLPNLQKLCLSVDFITDALVTMISEHLVSLAHLDLRDSPATEPRMAFDLTNNGVQRINARGKLKHLCLVRSQAASPSYFKRVNDLGILLMADRCAALESVHLGGFCQVTDSGYKTLLHSCRRLYKLRVHHGTHLTDLVFHDIRATSLSLTHVTLRWCGLVTNLTVSRLASNENLSVLDLRECRSLGDEALRSVSSLPGLRTLLLDGCDVSDAGISYLSTGPAGRNLVSLSLRGCRRLTDRCIGGGPMFDGSVSSLRELDLSNLPNVSDSAVLALARGRVPVTELRVRQCPLVGDTSVVALASMRCRGGSLRLLDVYNCGGMTEASLRWLRRPYF